MPRWAKTKKEERDNRPGLALEKPRLPAPPGRASVGGGEPVRPVPGASEWDPLARVRRGVRKPFLAATSRRTEQGELLRHVRRPRQHRGTLGAVEARRRRGEGRAAACKQPCGRDGGSQHEIVSALRTTAAPDAGRAPAGRRHARHRRRWNLRARTTRSRAPWRRAGEPRRSRGAAATRRRRGSAGRPGGAAGQSERSGAKTTWAGFRGTARRGNIWLQGSARAGRSATTVPAGSREGSHVTPGAPRSARVRPLTRRGARDRPRRTRKQVLRQGRHRNDLRRGKAAKSRNARRWRRSDPFERRRERCPMNSMTRSTR